VSQGRHFLFYHKRKGGIAMNELSKYAFINIEKIVQIFYYIQQRAEVTTKLELIKFLFFGDRINIREHFSLISLDTYVAMKYGPVASNSLNILNKKNERLYNFSTKELKFLDNIKKIDKNKRKINPVDSDLLSKNELSSLDNSIMLFYRKKLVDISHDYPEWKRYKAFFEQNNNSSKDIIMEDFFKNPDPNDSPAIKKYFGGIDPLYKDEEYLAEAKKFYFESISQS
jgi:hypothetical protein